MESKRLKLQITLLLMVIALVWAASWGITTSPPRLESQINFADQATLLFGASSIALIILSTIIAITAVVGWQAIKDLIQQRVETATQEKLAELETELRGRVVSVLGHTLGLLSTEPDSLEPLDRDRLAEAVRHCKIGYDLLEKIGGPARFMALNNLVYYSCINGDASRSRYLLQEARSLRDAGQKHNAQHLLLTFCRVILHYGEDPKEINEACTIARALAQNNQLPDSQRREARFYLASLEKKQNSSPSVSASF